jgi:hypothetical protein
VGGGNPGVGGRFSTLNLPNPLGGDANNVTGGSRQLANDFVWGNSGNDVESITINGLTVGTEYIATIYSVAWETGTRAATFSVGEDRLTVNQDQFDDNNGIRVSYHYVATDTSITLSYRPLQNNTFHTYGFINYEATTPTPPTIGQQPITHCVARGQDATFTVVAAGSEPLSYQWQKDGVALTGENNSTLFVPNVDISSAGVYSVVVQNFVDSAASLGARLEIGLNTIVNPSFEADSFSVFPGYVSGNGPITGWNALGGHGINPGNSFSPFADNGTIPNGSKVAFMQADGALSQMVSGFSPGTDYYVVYFENARGGNLPSIAVTVGGTTVVPAHPRSSVGGAAPYVKVVSDVFTATAATLELAFIKSNPQGGDTTALIDNVCVVEVPANNPAIFIHQPQNAVAQVGEGATFSVDVVGSLPFTYQWRKEGVKIDGATSRTFSIASVTKADEANYSVVVSNSGGDSPSADAHLFVFEPIPDLFNTGVDSLHAVIADGQIDPHYTLITNADGASINAIVEDSTTFPISTGTWLFDTTVSKWIGPRLNTAAAAGGRYVYRTTIDLTGRDPSTVVIIGRWSVDNTGVDIFVNGVSTFNPQSPGFGSYTPFAIASSNATFVAGINNIDFITDNAGGGYTGLRVEILQSNVKIPPGISPTITLQPHDQSATVGDTASFNVTATGSPILTYQWKKNGVDLSGKTSPILLLNNVVAADSGQYTVRVTNDSGFVDSNPASLCVPFLRLPGVIFGTGVDGANLAANGSIDLNYILAASADTNYPGTDAIVVDDTTAPIPPWLSSGPKSKWIAPRAEQNIGNEPGNYTYQTFFDLSGYNTTQVRLVGQWAVDNTGIDILVNGVSTGITSPGFTSFTPFVINTGFIAGLNTLDFIVNNGSPGVNPAGLRVDLEAQITIQPSMTITQTGDLVTVTWENASPCQILQCAESVTGPWTRLTGAKSGYSVHTGGVNPVTKFFKIAP